MVDNGSPPARRRRLSSLQFHLLAAALVLAMGLAAGVLRASAEPGEATPYGLWVIAAAVIIGGGVAIAAWRRLDEAAREAHKWAWYWGASAGMLGALVLFLMGDAGIALIGRVGLRDTFEHGVTVVLALEIVGYLVAWAFWWLKRR